MSKLTPLGTQLVESIVRSRDYADKLEIAQAKEEKIHIAGVGRTITAAYEQLRNAAEYTEEDLLLQRAIRRFFRRIFMTRDEPRIGESGEELVMELTLSGYISNDSMTRSTLEKINKLALAYYRTNKQLQHDGASSTENFEWTISLLAVEIEILIGDHRYDSAFIEFSYQNFLKFVNFDRVFEGKPPEEHKVMLLIAVYRALLKVDDATIRYELLRRYQVTVENYDRFRSLNQQIDKLLRSPSTEKLMNVVNRRGAPYRILWRTIKENGDISQLLESRDSFLIAYQNQITTEYTQMNSKINRGIMKSVIFLIISKVIIGALIEIPYDLWIHHAIIWLPLAVNLAFPPLYMILLRLTLIIPGQANTTALTDRIDNLIYQSSANTITASMNSTKKYSNVFNVAYSFMITVVFMVTIWILWKLDFEPLHMVIFFTFLSTASFLGFRLSRNIREIEEVDTRQSGITMLRDLLYMPFVVVGRWISDKYSKVNIVALTLDMLIELPLKTVIRLVRQWSAFLRSKADDMY